MTVQRKIFWLRLVTLVGLCLPALELAWRWYSDDLGPRPVTVATHATGDWAVIFLMLSLAMTPARALFDWMPLIHIRRRIGVAAACYAGAHFLIYVLDQKWNLIVVATEIAKRFYLTIGFVALLMLVALAITSTDGWQKRLRRNWKRLHWLIYPAAFIALVHFFIQSKVKIGEPAFTAGLFAWLMLWRVLPVEAAHALHRPCPAGRGRHPGRRPVRSRLVRPGERHRSRPRPDGQSRHRLRPGAPASPQGADRLAAGHAVGGAPPAGPGRKQALDAALYAVDYTGSLKRRLVC